jgi:hypothetical protein
MLIGKPFLNKYSIKKERGNEKKELKNMFKVKKQKKLRYIYIYIYTLHLFCI